jgi:GTP1/Obg family GTP-binding protein
VASLKELKGRINSVKSTQKITKAKQMVAAAKLRKAQAAAEAARPYGARLADVMASLASKVAGQDSAPLLMRCFPILRPKLTLIPTIGVPGFASAWRMTQVVTGGGRVARFAGLSRLPSNRGAF